MLFIITGGTIDKLPRLLADGVTFDNNSKFFDTTHVPEMLRKVRFLNDYEFKQLFMIDSLDMTDKHRKEILKSILASSRERIIITHGTDGMSETAEFLKRMIQIEEKTIVLTGAMVPYRMGEMSDALFNLGTAIAFAQSLPAGIYVAMNGRAYEAGNVRKDRKAGIFTTLEAGPVSLHQAP